jgi:hypothetical protein
MERNVLPYIFAPSGEIGTRGESALGAFCPGRDMSVEIWPGRHSVVGSYQCEGSS